jgi:hypothetical protein
MPCPLSLVLCSDAETGAWKARTTILYKWPAAVQSGPRHMQRQYGQQHSNEQQVAPPFIRTPASNRGSVGVPKAAAD